LATCQRPNLVRNCIAGFLAMGALAIAACSFCDSQTTHRSLLPASKQKIGQYVQWGTDDVHKGILVAKSGHWYNTRVIKIKVKPGTPLPEEFSLVDGEVRSVKSKKLTAWDPSLSGARPSSASLSRRGTGATLGEEDAAIRILETELERVNAQLFAILEEEKPNGGTPEMTQELAKMKQELSAQQDLVAEAATSVQTLEDLMDKQDAGFKDQMRSKEAEFRDLLADKLVKQKQRLAPQLKACLIRQTTKNIRERKTRFLDAVNQEDFHKCADISARVAAIFAEFFQ